MTDKGGKIAMMQIVICDDETRILPKLRDEINVILIEKKIEANFRLFDRCETLLTSYEELEADVIFLDIDLPGMSGFELARKLTEKESKAILVFVTNQDALVYESFSFHPFAFIRKAYFEQEIAGVLDRLITEVKKIPEYYSFQTGSECTRVTIASMVYFEADGNYVKLVTTKECFRIRDTLANLAVQFEAAGFIRIHKGFLVNQSYIAAIRQSEVELQDKTLLPISRTNRELVRAQLMKYLR